MANLFYVSLTTILAEACQIIDCDCEKKDLPKACLFSLEENGSGCCTKNETSKPEVNTTTLGPPTRGSGHSFNQMLLFTKIMLLLDLCLMFLK